MDLNKKSVSGKKTGQTLNFDAKGFRKNMFWNPSTVEFFYTLAASGFEPSTSRTLATYATDVAKKSERI